MVVVERPCSQSPCVTPRGVQQKRAWNARRRQSSGAKCRAVAHSEPGCSLVKHDWECRAPGRSAKAACDHAQLDVVVAIPRGSRDSTTRKHCVEHGRSQRVRVAPETRLASLPGERPGLGEKSEGSVVPVKAVKAAGGKGPRSVLRLEATKEGDCGDARNS